MSEENSRASDFIRDIISNDLQEGKRTSIITRFPPEPNGYLHIGHAKSICLNFGIAREFNGVCHIRMDDTNPVKEDEEYVDSIQQDIRWLLTGWAEDRIGLKKAGETPQPEMVDGKEDFHAKVCEEKGVALEPFYASDYFEALYHFALKLIKAGKAYVCDLSPEEVDQMRGAPDKPGQESPYRNRSIEENLDLFIRMKNGEFPDGSRTLRAKVDMSSPNVWMRDPLIYRIRHASHHHTGDKWCIYPLYDFAHCISDYIEGITHSICTLEFVVHRAIYDWFLEALDLPRQLPHQYEFARLNLTYTVMSKRKLLALVQQGKVSGWDDPRMPTIAGMRRRGYPASSLRLFCEKIGVAKRENVIDVSLLEFCVREQLNKTALRVMGVLRPLKVVIDNYPEGKTEELEAINNPEDLSAGTRKLLFGREIYIEQDDFREVPPPKYYRLVPGKEVRLRYAYIIKCESVVKDAEGNVIEVHCTYDPDSKAGGPTAGRKVKGTIHWVSVQHAVKHEVRLYDRLFNVEDPADESDGTDWMSHLNPNSLEVLSESYIEPSVVGAAPGTVFQFERMGYFALDSAKGQQGEPVFNRTVTLRDSWAKAQKKNS